MRSKIKFSHSGYDYDDLIFEIKDEHLFETLYHYVAFLAESGESVEYKGKEIE